MNSGICLWYVHLTQQKLVGSTEKNLEGTGFHVISPKGVRLTLLLLHFSGTQEITAPGKAYLRFSKTLDIGASKE